MFHAEVPKILPAILGSLCQDRAEGTLILDQNDGTRRLYWQNGQLVYLQSSVAGEQLGNYLLRQGIIDYKALSELLASEEHFRIGEKVVQWGLLTVEERDRHLNALQEQVMVHALEHDIIQMEWNQGLIPAQLSDDLRFKLNHRAFIWNTFQEAHNLGYVSDLLYAEPSWRWTAQPDLLDSMSDLPLTPQMAYSLSFLGAEPVGYETLLSLSGMGEEEAARLIVVLWALGGLTLTEGKAPKLLPGPPQMPLDFAPAPEESHPPQPVVPSGFLPPPLDSLHTVPLEFAPPEIPSVPHPDLNIALADEHEEVLPLEPEAQREPSTVRARKCLVKAKAYILQDRMAEAIRLLEESVRLDPESEQAFDAWLLLGKHRLTNPAWSTRAVEALQVASRIKPKAGEPWALMGDLYHRKGFKANAKACFKKALELDPSYPIPPDLNLNEEDEDPEAKGLLRRFKSMLGR